MKIIVYKTLIEIKTFSPDSVPALLREIAECIRFENTAGELTKSDSDTVKWSILASKQKEL